MRSAITLQVEGNKTFAPLSNLNSETSPIPHPDMAGGVQGALGDHQDDVATPPSANQPNLVIQFRNANDNNAPLGPPINIPAGAGQRELALLVNQLRRQLRAQNKTKRKHMVDDINAELPPSDDEDDEDLPYAFHVAIPPTQAQQPSTAIPENTRITISSSIQSDVLASKPAGQLGWSTESLLDIVFEPQAVFRVRAVNRCSSSLTGHASPILCSTFSPSGRLLLTGSGDKTARIWDLISIDADPASAHSGIGSPTSGKAESAAMAHLIRLAQCPFRTGHGSLSLGHFSIYGQLQHDTF
ncbi:hypothetical protein V8E36_002538 [Tilletia maclaganii]